MDSSSAPMYVLLPENAGTCNRYSRGIGESRRNVLFVGQKSAQITADRDFKYTNLRNAEAWKSRRKVTYKVALCTACDCPGRNGRWRRFTMALISGGRALWTEKR